MAGCASHACLSWPGWNCPVIRSLACLLQRCPLEVHWCQGMHAMGDFENRPYAQASAIVSASRTSWLFHRKQICCPLWILRLLFSAFLRLPLQLPFFWN